MASDLRNRERASILRPLLVALVLASAAATTSVSTTAYADEPSAADRESARRLMAEGRDRREAHDERGALESFRAAHALMHVPTTGAELAQSQAALGLLVEAHETALEVARMPRAPNDPAPFETARLKCAALGDALKPRIPTLRIRVAIDARSPVLRIDGVAVPLPSNEALRAVDPGTHQIEVEAAGGRWRRAVNVFEAQTKEVVVDGPPETAATAQPTPATPESKTMAHEEHPVPEAKGSSALLIGGFATGATGVAVGSIAGLIALGQTGTARAPCVGNKCPPSDAPAIATARTTSVISDVAFVVGAIGVGVGVYGLVTRSSPAVDVALGPRALTLRGQF